MKTETFNEYISRISDLHEPQFRENVNEICNDIRKMSDEDFKQFLLELAPMIQWCLDET